MIFPALYIDRGPGTAAAFGSRHWRGSGGLRAAAGTLCSMLICLGIGFATAAEIKSLGSEPAQARNLAFVIYDHEGTTPLATIKVASLFTDHETMGFFRVNLLPYPVLQGVRVEVAQGSKAVDWLSALRLNLPAGDDNGAEVRDLSVGVASDAGPRLAIGRLRFGAGGNAQTAWLEDVTLQIGGGVVKLPRARLQAAAAGPRLFWTEAGRDMTWDLFTRAVVIDSAAPKP